MLNNKIIFLILIFLLALLFILSQRVKEGFSDFDDQIGIKSLDDKDFEDNKGGVGIFKDKFASYESLDLHKPKNLKYGKIDKFIPMTQQSTLVKPKKIQELQFLEKLRDISRVTNVQFKETKLTSLYPSDINIGENQMREEQPYNIGEYEQKDSILDVKLDQEKIVKDQNKDFLKNTGENKLTQAKKFSKMIKDAEKKEKTK